MSGIFVHRVFTWAPVLIACSAWIHGANGQDRFYVMPDGTQVPLYRNPGELGVIFTSADVAIEGAERIADLGFGNVVNIPNAETAPVKLLKLSVATGGDVVTPEMLSAIQSDPAVREVREVYRYAPVGRPVFLSGRIVLKFGPGISATARQQLFSEFEVTVVDTFRTMADVYVVSPNDSKADETMIAARLASNPAVSWANPDFYRILSPKQAVPSDQYFNLQWHLNNTGQSGGAIDADIDAIEAWQISTGSGVLIGMFDQACDVDHEDLRDNYIGFGQDVNVPFFDDDYTNPRPKTGLESHGTAVMGLAVAAPNAVGVRGVAYQARFTATRSSFFITDTGVASGFEFAIENNVDVHINSWGFDEAGPLPPVIEEAITTAVQEGRDPDGDGPLPPRGMVVVFAAGNENRQIIPGFDLPGIPGVIGVGASTQDDTRADFSNFGEALWIMAPGGVDFNFGVTTTDNTDTLPSPGYNIQGRLIFGGPDIDPDGLYTGFFGGTSAACPVAAGVAGLVLSVNPELTVRQVRTLLQHSCDQIDPVEAQYDGVSAKSFKYGYGRINANLAVRAARDSLDFGVWPEDPSNLHVDGTMLRWSAGDGAAEFLVVEATNTFNFLPQDGFCYSNNQADCAGATLEDLPSGTKVAYVGCPADNCSDGMEQAIEFVRPRVGTKLLAVYARSATGLYSYGSSVTVQAVQPPAVTITATPLTGNSPVTVRFNGNAVSEVDIDDSRTQWDFDLTNLIGDNISINATTRSAFYTYTAPLGVTRNYTARLTMYDALGTPGFAQVAIQVVGPEVPDDIGSVNEFGMRIVATIPGQGASEADIGRSPFSVLLRVEADTPTTIQSVVWNLGDGSSTVGGLSVLHTYINPDQTNRSFVVTATVTALTSGGTPVVRTFTRLITVTPGSTQPNTEEPKLPGTEVYGDGGAVTVCGVVGMIPMFLMAGALLLMRRRRR